MPTHLRQIAPGIAIDSQKGLNAATPMLCGRSKLVAACLPARFPRRFRDNNPAWLSAKHASDRPNFGRRLGPPVQPLGRARGAFDPRLAGVPGGGEPPSVRAAHRTAEAAAVARSAQSARICRAHHAAHADRHGAVAGLHLHLCDARRQEQTAERLLVPLLDILQSVPILGFISVTVVFFMALAPGRVLGAEFAAIFAIFTSQAWNMAFSFYQSLRTVPTELEEASRNFRLSPWMTVLAARRAVRHAAADLEHDDVDVGELVLRRRLGSDQRRQHHGDAARRRLLHRARHRAAGSAARRAGRSAPC